MPGWRFSPQRPPRTARSLFLRVRRAAAEAGSRPYLVSRSVMFVEETPGVREIGRAVGGEILDLEVCHDTLHVAGSFTEIGGVMARQLACRVIGPSQHRAPR